MTDLLSIIASVVGISAAAVQASTAVVDLVRTIKDAPREIQTILTDLDDFKGLVSKLNVNLESQMIQDVLRGDKGLTDTVKSVSSPLKSCATEMAHLGSRIAKNLKPAKEGSSQRFISTTWYWRRSEIVECMSRLQSNKMNLNIALSAVVSYCTLRSYAMDSGTMNKAISARRNSDDTDAGSALKQYAASIVQDTRSMVNCEEDSDPKSDLVERLRTCDAESEQLNKKDGLVDELLKATRAHDLLLMKELIEKGVDINRHSCKGKAPIHVAAESGTYDAVATLLNHHADLNNPMRGGRIVSVGQTPLHLAVSREHKNIIQLLLAHGADINARTPKEHTPLHCAISPGHLNIVEMLIKKGANIHMSGGRTTALHYAVKCGHLDVVQVLVEGGADIEACTDRPGCLFQTPLMAACWYQQLDIIAFLLKAGAKIDACQPDGIQAIHVISRFRGSSLESTPQKKDKLARFRGKTASVY